MLPDFHLYANPSQHQRSENLPLNQSFYFSPYKYLWMSKIIQRYFFMRREKIDISQVHPNEGQIEGLPANPRLIKDGRFKKLLKSVQSLPEMTEARDLLVYPYNGEYVVIGGNMRLRAYRELGWKEAPCCVLPEDMPVEKLRAIVFRTTTRSARTTGICWPTNGTLRNWPKFLVLIQRALFQTIARMSYSYTRIMWISVRI